MNQLAQPLGRNIQTLAYDDALREAIGKLIYSNVN